METLKYNTGPKLNLGFNKYQDKIAITLCQYFKMTEIEEIYFDDIIFPGEDNDYIHENAFENIYKIEFDSGRSLEINSILNIQNINDGQFLDLRLITKDDFKIDIKCELSGSKTKSFLNLIIAKALNFKMYCKSTDTIVNNRQIIRNFTIKILKDLSKDEILNLSNMVLVKILHNPEFISNKLITDCNIFSSREHNFSIICDRIGLVKFIYTNLESGEESYIYVPRTKVGINTLQLIADRALAHYDGSTEDEVFENPIDPVE